MSAMMAMQKTGTGAIANARLSMGGNAKVRTV